MTREEVRADLARLGIDTTKATARVLAAVGRAKTMQTVNATTLDNVRIEVVGESRAVTCPGLVWVQLRERAETLAAALREIAALTPDIAQLLDGWHADGTAWSEWDESVRRRLADWHQQFDAVARQLLTEDSHS